MSTHRTPIAAERAAPVTGAACVLLLHGLDSAVEGLVRGVAGHEPLIVIVQPADADLGAAIRAHEPEVVLVQAPSPSDGDGVFGALSPEDVAAGPPAIAVVTGDGAAQRVSAVRKAGARDVLVAPFGGPEIAARIAAARDASRTARELERLRGHLAAQQQAAEDQTQEIGALSRVAMAVASGTALSEVFSRLAGEVITLVGCEAAHVAFREDSGEVTLVGVAATGQSVVNALGMRADVAVNATGLAVAEGRPQRIDDQTRIDDGLCAHLLGWGSSVAVPVMFDDRVWGAVGAVAAGPHGVRFGTRRTLERFAELVTLAIGNAQSSAHSRQLALRDHLTGLYNRRAFEDALKAEMRTAARHGIPVSLMLLDIDEFKRVNDTYGHLVGDGVLSELAMRLKGAVRSAEVLARVGGEEFALLMPRTDVSGGVRAGERLRAAVEAEPFPHVGRVTVSVGVAQAWDLVDTDAVFGAADEALYRSKRDGRNRVSAADPSPPALDPDVNRANNI